MGKVQLVKLSIKGISEHAVSAPGHPNLWRTIEKTCGPLRFYRSQALVLEWTSDQGTQRLPTAEEWQSWLCVPGLHILEILEKAQHTTVQIRRTGLDPDILPMLARETLRLKGFSALKQVWLARQTEIVFEKSVQQADKAALLATLKLVSSLGEKSGLFRPSHEQMRVVLAGEGFAWPIQTERNLYSHQKLKEKTIKHFREGSRSLLSRYHVTGLLEEWTKKEIGQIRGYPKRKLLEACSTKNLVGAGDTAPVDFIVALPQNPDSYSSMDKLRIRCEGFANLLDRPLGQVRFRKSFSGVSLFDCWSELGSHQKIDQERIGNHHVLCVLGAWDRRNPLGERRVDAFLSRLSTLDANSQFLYEILPAAQNWIISMMGRLVGVGRDWKIGGDELTRFLFLTESTSENSCLVLGWVLESSLSKVEAEAAKYSIDFFVLARRGASGGVRVLDKSGAEICELSEQEYFSTASTNDFPVQSALMMKEEKAPVYGFDRAGTYVDEFLLRQSFRESSYIEWVREFIRNSSGTGRRSLALRNSAVDPLKSYRWTDGQKVFAKAIGCNTESRKHKPKESAFYALDSALRELLVMGGNPREATIEVMISVPEVNSPVPMEFEASLALQLDSLGSLLREYKIPYKSTQEITTRLDSTYSEVFVRATAVLPQNYPPPFPGFRMAGERVYALGPKATFMDAGSKVLDFFSRIDSNFLSIIPAAALFEIYDLVADMEKNSLLSSIRAVDDGGIAGALAEMTLWSNMGCMLGPNLGAIDLFSAAPGRFLVGVLPSNVARFEAAVKKEWFLPVATVGGEKIFGMAISKLRSVRCGRGA